MTYSNFISKSWKAVEGNIAMYAGLSLLALFVVVLSNMIPFFGSFIGGVVNLGYLVCIKKLSKGETIEFQDFFWGFSSLPKFIQSILLVLLTTIIIVIGFILLIIPGFWASVALSLGYVIFIHQNGEHDAVAAIKKSIRLVQDRWFWMAGFLSIYVFLNLLGFLALGVGLLITVPMTTLSMIYLLEHLESNTLTVSPNV